MTTQGVNPEEFPTSGEPQIETLTLESRYPKLVLPEHTMWPVKLHDEKIRLEVAESLPQLVGALSEPVQSATPAQISDIFAKNPHERRTPWKLREERDGGYTYSSDYYEGSTVDGRTPLFWGLNYTFDSNGRITKLEMMDGGRSYNSGRAQYQEFLNYDEDGYLAERTTWGYIDPTVTDRFEYAVDEAGKKTPAKMTRTIKTQGDDSVPMTVDLANYEEWLSTNPNGFTALLKEQIEHEELSVKDFNVSEYRKGILFSHPEHLELALVMYGDGSYPTPGGETALEHNDKVFAEGSSLGGALFSLMARRGDMGEFVQSRIMESVQAKWQAVQKSRKSDANESSHFSFDYDGAGHFHKTFGDVKITKGGLELTLGAAYVGDQVEDQLASALGKKRGLQNATIEVPVNQSEREGYFFIDVKGVCDKLGIPVTEQDVATYLDEYLGDQDDNDPRTRYDKQWGRQPALWQDKATGVSVILVTQRHDYDSSTDIDKFFSHDGTSVWGPLPKEIRHIGDSKKNLPKIKVIIEPSGNPFDEETTKRTDETIRSYMSKLEEASA